MEDYLIFEDDNIIVTNKPFGMLCQKDKKGDDENLYDLVKNYVLKKNKSAKVGLINRLDRVVGGLVIFGKNEATNKFLSENVHKQKIFKYYLAVVCGNAKKEDFLNDWLLKNERLNISKVVNKNNHNSKEAKLIYKKINECIFENEVLSLLEIELLTGRHHQIRVQMSNQNLPIYNDSKYNTKFLRKKTGEIGLFAYKLKILKPDLSDYINIEILPKNYNESIFKKFY